MTKKEVPKNANKFSCERCYFQCSKESNCNRHLVTREHKIRTNTNEKVPKNAEQYVIVVKSINMHLHFGITKRIAKMKGIMLSSKLKLIHQLIMKIW